MKTTKPLKKVKANKSRDIPEEFEGSLVQEVKPEIALLPLDFGREDLNLIAQKVNELILLSK